MLLLRVQELQLEPSSTAVGLSILNTGTGNDVTDGSKWVVKSTGFFGINTTTPTQTLEVKGGNFNVSGKSYLYGNATLKAPNGTLYNCGVGNTGTLSCSWLS